MERFSFYNKELTELVQKKLSEYKYIPLPDVWLKKLNKPTNEEVIGNKKQLIRKIRKSYLVSIDKLIYTVGNFLAKSVAYNPIQKQNKWQYAVIDLPVKESKYELVPHHCLFYGGTYHDYKDNALKLSIDNEAFGEKIFNEQLAWINRGQLLIIAPDKKNKVVDVKNPKVFREEYLINKKKKYPHITYGTNFSYYKKDILNILDNLIAQNLVKNGVLTKAEVKDALKENYISLPTRETAKNKNFEYELKPGVEPDINEQFETFLKKNSK